MGEKQLIKERIANLMKLQELSVDLYPYSYKRTHFSALLKEKFDYLKNGESTEHRVTIAGRLMALREMGKASFCEIQDETGRIQIYIREDSLKEQYDIFKHLDIGDLVGIQGFIFKTKVGELTIHVKDLVLLCKCLRPLPEKFHGLQDIEIRYRKRALDLIMNPQIKEVFKTRSKIISFFRSFLEKEGYLEVEIPTLQVYYGGADARPFVTHINAWDLDLFLSISPELYLKQLIIGGMGPVFTITKCFRNEGVDKTHNPEFTMMECYKPYVDYQDVIRLIEELISETALAVNGSMIISVDGHTLDLTPPWPCLAMTDAIKKYADIDVGVLSDDELNTILSNYNICYEGDFSRGLAVEKIFEELVEDKLIQPVHIIDHPMESSPLCKGHRKKEGFIERVESYVNGFEISNGYSELNDARLQRVLLEAQEEKKQRGEEHYPMDENFVEMLEYGMPPTGGLGIGIDRIVVLLLEQKGIRDVLLFPTMKPEKKE